MTGFGWRHLAGRRTRDNYLQLPTVFFIFATAFILTNGLAGISTYMLMAPPPDGYGLDAGNSIKATMLFDRGSRLRKVIDDNGRQATLTYDNADRLKESVDQKGNKVTLTYDANSNVTQRVTTELEADGVTTKTFTSGIVVDELDRVVSTKDQGPDGIYGNADDRISAYRYDSRGNLTGLIDPKGTVSKILYDALSRRVETQRDPTGLNIVTKFVYDRNSRLNKYIGIRNNADPANQQHATTYGYDRLDRLVNTGAVGGADAPFVAGAAKGGLVVQVLATVPGGKKIAIGK
jgi:YD repeat-containing protein